MEIREGLRAKKVKLRHLKPKPVVSFGICGYIRGRPPATGKMCIAKMAVIGSKILLCSYRPDAKLTSPTLDARHIQRTSLDFPCKEQR